jgi:hypothetical protein
MDRDTLNSAISDGAIRVTMNDGSTYDIQDQKSMLVDATTAYVLQRSTDGRLRAVWLSLVRMVKVERLLTAPIA